LSDALVSSVNCALCEALYGLDQIGIRLGDTVVIQGAGGLGLYGAALAKEMGAGQVIVLGRRAERLTLAQAFGADLTLSSEETSEEERRQCVLDRTQGQGADVVAEFVGSPQPVAEGVRLLRPGGRYLWIGNVTPGLFCDFDPGTLVRTAQSIKGAIAYEPWVLPRALASWSAASAASTPTPLSGLSRTLSPSPRSTRPLPLPVRDRPCECR
jgi:threonine dehydrogenase-like Zn-dependent dehydrogenase